jgi:WhiB family redox-sensing transcriptional regulator
MRLPFRRPVSRPECYGNPPPKGMPSPSECPHTATVDRMTVAESAWLLSSPLHAPDPMAAVVNRPAWQDLAACRNRDTADYFPARGEPTADALATCAGCGVRGACLAFALAEPLLTGVWGGTTQRQRRAIRTPAGPVPIRHGSQAGYSLETRRHTGHCRACREAHADYLARWRAGTARRGVAQASPTNPRTTLAACVHWSDTP